MLFKVASTRLISNLPKNPIAECKPFFRIRFFTEGLFQYLCDE
jgi:hypothetical protein